MTSAPPAPSQRSGRHEAKLDPLTVLAMELPIKSGEFRRIHRISDTSYYRVNFHRLSDNTISRSYFVLCEGNKAEVRNAE